MLKNFCSLDIEQAQLSYVRQQTIQ